MTDGASVSGTASASRPGLARLVAVVERLHRDHTVSFIQAGDEKIYAYGGGGYVAIVSDRLFDSVVDFETATMNFRIEPGENGLNVTSGATDENALTDESLSAVADGFERYYSRRIGRV